MSICLPEQFKIMQGAPPTTTNGAVTGDYVSLKNAHRVWVIFELTQAVGHATVCSLMRATAVAPTGATAVTESVKIWENEDTGSTDTLVRQTDATSVTLGADIKNKQVIMEIVPQGLTATFDCIAGVTSASSQSSNFVSMTYILETRYAQATPPTAITD